MLPRHQGTRSRVLGTLSLQEGGVGLGPRASPLPPWFSQQFLLSHTGRPRGCLWLMVEGSGFLDVSVSSGLGVRILAVTSSSRVPAPNLGAAPPPPPGLQALGGGRGAAGAGGTGEALPGCLPGGDFRKGLSEGGGEVCLLSCARPATQRPKVRPHPPPGLGQGFAGLAHRPQQAPGAAAEGSGLSSGLTSPALPTTQGSSSRHPAPAHTHTRRLSGPQRDSWGRPQPQPCTTHASAPATGKRSP